MIKALTTITVLSMSNIDLKTQDKKLNLLPGQRLTDTERMGILIDLCEQMDTREVRKSDIVKVYGVDWQTAVRWYNQAVMLTAKGDNNLTREGKRAIHEGQINRRINELLTLLEVESNNLSLDDQLKIHDRVVKYLDSRARITGLNSEQVNVSHELKPLMIQRADVIDV